MKQNIEILKISCNDCCTSHRKTSIPSSRNISDKKTKYQYSGYGVVSTGKKFMIDNIKKLINSVNKKDIAQKVGDH